MFSGEPRSTISSYEIDVHILFSGNRFCNAFIFMNNLKLSLFFSLQRVWFCFCFFPLHRHKDDLDLLSTNPQHISGIVFETYISSSFFSTQYFLQIEQCATLKALNKAPCMIYYCLFLELTITGQNQKLLCLILTEIMNR